MLGGAHTQVPSIKKAVEMGFYTISCDYLPNNPGHKFSHEYHNVSTTDKEAVLALAKKLKIDGIVCYASDPAAATAAYVSEKMGFPASPYKSVEILSNKDQFRAFMRENGFYCPKAKGYAENEVQKSLSELTEFSLPVVVKPVDSCSSKGVTVLKDSSKLKEAIEYALSFSRAKRFIIEELFEKVGYQLGGDGFSVNGKLVFRCFSNSHMYAINPIVPFGESFPYILPKETQTKIHNEFQRVLTLLDMKTGAYNLEARLNKKGDIFFQARIDPVPRPIRFIFSFFNIGGRQIMKTAPVFPQAADAVKPPYGGFNHSGVNIKRVYCVKDRVFRASVVSLHKHGDAVGLAA